MRDIFARKSPGRVNHSEKNSKVEREEKKRDKVNELHEESELLIKTYGGD